jgi:ribosomal protein S18 acetylase RimI-like enzyme
MTAEPDLYYLCVPRQRAEVALPVDFLPVSAFVTDEPACRMLWDMITTQFHTRGKFLAIWPNVRYLAVQRDEQGVAGFCFVSTPVNWQIDYVVVRPDARGRHIATALVHTVLNHALAQNVPYVMLTSRESLRKLYEGECGFSVVGASRDRGPG